MRQKKCLFLNLTLHFYLNAWWFTIIAWTFRQLTFLSSKSLNLFVQNNLKFLNSVLLLPNKNNSIVHHNVEIKAICSNSIFMVILFAQGHPFFPILYFGTFLSWVNDGTLRFCYLSSPFDFAIQHTKFVLDWEHERATCQFNGRVNKKISHLNIAKLRLVPLNLTSTTKYTNFNYNIIFWNIPL